MKSWLESLRDMLKNLKEGNQVTIPVEGAEAIISEHDSLILNINSLQERNDIAIKIAAVFMTLYIGATEETSEKLISLLDTMIPANEGTRSIEQIREAVMKIAAE